MYCRGYLGFRAELVILKKQIKVSDLEWICYHEDIDEGRASLHFQSQLESLETRFHLFAFER